MDAKEAKQKADSYNRVNDSVGLTLILDRIQTAVKKGQYAVSVTHLSNGTRKLLEEMGYKITTHSDIRDASSSSIISWS